MGWLRNIFGGNEYQNCGTYFHRRKVFLATTVCDYKVRYEVVCDYQKVDEEKFKSARMLEEQNRDHFVELVNSNVVVPVLKSNGRFWRLYERSHNEGGLCVPDAGIVYLDHSCIKLNEELKAARFGDSGCVINSVRIFACEQSPEIIEENYNQMIALHAVDSIKNSAEYVAKEEAMLVACAKRMLELNAALLLALTDQTHEGKRAVIGTRLFGRMLEFRWKFKEPLSGPRSLKGYAKSGGFSEDFLPLDQNGPCLVDSKCDSRSVVNLAAGTTYFVTFVIVYTGGKALEIEDSVRFSITIPTGEELARTNQFAALLEKKPEKQPTLSKRTSDALEELNSFVEFEETISQVEKQLVEQISAKPYSPEEKSEKIDRLKAVVESLRMGA